MEPDRTGERDSYGALVEGPPIAHPVWAVREDKPSGAEGLVAPGVEGGSWAVHYTIREESVSKRPTEDWWVVDENGQRLELEGVFEKNSGPRARRLVLVCERTGT